MRSGPGTLEHAILDYRKRVDARDTVQSNVERIQKTAIRRREGAAPVGIGGKQRMDRIDADEIAAMRRNLFAEGCEVFEIANTVIASRAKAIELAGHAPGAAGLQPMR